MDNLDMMSDFESVYPTVDDYFNFKKHTDSRYVSHLRRIPQRPWGFLNEDFEDEKIDDLR
jgi:hypothetical protein